MLITITLLVVVLGAVLGLLGLVSVIVLGVKHSPAAVRLSVIWTIYASVFAYMLSQSEFGTLSLTTLAVVGGTMIYLVFTSEGELLN